MYLYVKDEHAKAVATHLRDALERQPWQYEYVAAMVHFIEAIQKDLDSKEEATLDKKLEAQENPPPLVAEEPF